MKNTGQQKNFFSFASQLLIVTTATPISFDTELTLLFSGGSTFLKIESRNVFVYFIVAPPMGDNYIDTFRKLFLSVYRNSNYYKEAELLIIKTGIAVNTDCPHIYVFFSIKPSACPFVIFLLPDLLEPCYCCRGKALRSFPENCEPTEKVPQMNNFTKTIRNIRI